MEDIHELLDELIENKKPRPKAEVSSCKPNELTYAAVPKTSALKCRQCKLQIEEEYYWKSNTDNTSFCVPCAWELYELFPPGE